MEDITVKELAEQMTRLSEKYPNAKICLPDTKKGKKRYLSKGIYWSDKDMVCMTFNTYKGDE